MKQNERNDDTNEVALSSTLSKDKKAYSAPKILSAERLEAAAATCDPPTGALGKMFDIGPPIACSTLGS